MAKIFDYVKNLFWLLLILQLAPSLLKSIKLQYENVFESQTKVGLITIKGVLYDSTTHVRNLRKFFENNDIKAIVLKIESPGGAAGSAQAIFNEIKELKKNVSPKYVVTWIENIAASGGYYVASAADYIVTSPGALVGSIGAYIAHPYFKDFIETYKIKYDIVKTGEYKSVGSPFVELVPAQRELLQSVTDSTYQQFVNDVASQRSKAKLSANTKEWAEGKIFTGEQALKLGLVDKLGSQSTVMEVLKEHAPIIGKIDWVKPTSTKSVWQTLFSTEDEEESRSGLKSICNTVLHAVEERYTSTGINC